MNITYLNKWSNTSPLDGWNYALFSLEIIINIAYVIAVNLLFYICVSQKNLHVNFRYDFIFVVGFLQNCKYISFYLKLFAERETHGLKESPMD